jgi:large subunit ribosomal protein L6
VSRIGKQPISIPAGVTVKLDDDNVTVTGKNGVLSQVNLPGIKVVQEDGQIIVTRESEEWLHKSKHGLMRSLVNNMVVGVSDGFSKTLELNGVGYRVALAGDSLKLNLGFSHDVMFKIPAGINIKVEANTMVVSGMNKQQVGQVAAEIRSLKKPEPYKGKGIKYSTERVLRKSGKSGKEK